MSVEEIVKALGGRKAGSGYLVRCPAHQDHSPSLSIREKDEHLLVKCFAGCSSDQVIAALRGQGLWPINPQTRTPPRSIVAVYSYTDAEGKELYQVVRVEPGRNGKSKEFLQRYCDGEGRLIWRKHPNQVLYRLHQVLASSIVLVVEGEKDCETLHEQGFIATTNAGGANAAWLPQFTEALAGREVILIPDNDNAGRARVLHIARQLLGRVARLRIVNLEPPAKDITDWFALGHSEVELVNLIEGVAE